MVASDGRQCGLFLVKPEIVGNSCDLQDGIARGFYQAILAFLAFAGWVPPAKRNRTFWFLLTIMIMIFPDALNEIAGKDAIAALFDRDCHWFRHSMVGPRAFPNPYRRGAIFGSGKCRSGCCTIASQRGR